MFYKIFKIASFIFVVALIGTSCQYDKLLKSTDYQLKYNKAKEYYKKKDYSKAVGLFEQLNPVLKATGKADTVLYYLANSYFEQENYILAEHHYQQFYETFGNHGSSDDAEFKSAYCNYKLSPRPALDQSYTKKAINKFNLFITRHPNHEKVSRCHELIQELTDKLAMKAYKSARLYYEMEDYKAAVIALENALKRFPNTTHRKQIKFMILKSQYLLASNSVQSKKQERYQNTLDAYYTFTSEYPDSEYSGEVKEIYQSTQKHLTN